MIRVQPNSRGRRLVKHHTYLVTLRLWVSYTPTGGRQRDIGCCTYSNLRQTQRTAPLAEEIRQAT